MWIDGCMGVVVDLSGFDYYVVNYSDVVWSGLFMQINSFIDLVLLVNLKSEVVLFVVNNFVLVLCLMLIGLVVLLVVMKLCQMLSFGGIELVMK